MGAGWLVLILGLGLGMNAYAPKSQSIQTFQTTRTEASSPQQKPAAFFEFQTLPDDTFVFKLIDPEKIRAAQEILLKRYQKHVAGTIVKSSQPYNRPWSFHLDPNTVDFVVLTDSACDGAIRFVEDRLPAVGKTVLPNLRWRPVRADLLARGFRPKPVRDLLETIPPLHVVFRNLDRLSGSSLFNLVDDREHEAARVPRS